MALDEHGMLWLADPWSAVGFCVAVLGLFLLIHSRVSVARAPASPAMAVRQRRPRRARRAVVSAPRPSLGRALAVDAALAAARATRAAVAVCPGRDGDRQHRVAAGDRDGRAPVGNREGRIAA